MDYDEKDVGLRSPAEQEEILNKEVRLDGTGEDPIIQTVLSDEFAKMPDQEALSVAAALRDLIRGQAALLDNQKKQDEEVRKMRQRFEEMEESAQKWRDDPAHFADEARAKADKVRLTGDNKDKAIAEGARILQEQTAKANAEAATAELEFIQKCANAPKVTISSSGKVWKTKVGDGYVDRVQPDVIRRSVGKRSFEWVLFPNQPVDVPDFVAQEYWKSKRWVQEQDKVKEALLPDANGKFRNFDELQARFPELNPNNQAMGNVTRMNK
jgi:hypothetical protein